MRSAVIGRLLVAGQFGAIAVWAFTGPLGAPSAPLRALQGAGLALGLWAALWMSVRQRRRFSVTPLPDAHERLVTDGPYRWIRHPMYTAVLAVVLPAAFSGPWPSIAAGLTLASVIVAKYRFEDRLLSARFPAFEDYRRRTGALLPWLG